MILIAFSLSFFIHSLSASDDAIQNKSNTAFTCWSDTFGDVAPTVCGTFGCTSLAYKTAMCCATSDYNKSTECCYKLGCEYSWFPPCNQVVKCNNGYSCSGAPGQWITSIIAIVGCGMCLPWTVEKLCKGTRCWREKN